jgi:ferredoxin
MAHITSGDHSFEVADGTRLVLALEKNGIDVLHRCGGWARCTTCRVTFSDGEPERMTEAEKELLDARDLVGVRLSCQIECTGSMSAEPAMTIATSGFDDAGAAPEPTITPPPVWLD